MALNPSSLDHSLVEIIKTVKSTNWLAFEAIQTQPDQSTRPEVVREEEQHCPHPQQLLQPRLADENGYTKPTRESFFDKLEPLITDNQESFSLFSQKDLQDERHKVQVSQDSAMLASS